MLLLVTVVRLCSTPEVATAPQLSRAARQTYVSLAPVPQSNGISRGGDPLEHVERRVMRVTAYTSRDEGMSGKGITANGQKAVEGSTVASAPGIPFGSKITIPALGKTYTVMDRGGAIIGNRLDVYMKSRTDALKFGVQDLEVYVHIKEEKQ